MRSMLCAVFMMVVAGSTVERSHAAEAPAVTEHPNLSGHWTFDPDLSDDPREKMRAQASGGPGGGRGGRRGGMGSPGGGTRGPRGGMGGPGGGGPGGGIGDGDWGGGRGSRGERGGRGERGERGERGGGMRAPEVLDIEHAGDTLKVAAGEDDVRSYTTDGQEVELPGPEGSATKIKAKWDGDKLVIERKTVGEQGTTNVKQTYELGPGGKPLNVTVEMDGRFGKVSLLRVYQRGEAAAGEAAEPPEPATESPAAGP